MLWPLLLRADDCCSDDSIVGSRIVSLAEEIGTVGYALATQESGQAFATDTLKKQALRLHLFAETPASEKCRRKKQRVKIEMASISLRVRASAF